MRGSIRFLQIEEGSVIDDQKALGEYIVRFYKDFHSSVRQGGQDYPPLLDPIPQLLSVAQAKELDSIPLVDEIKATVFSLNPSSASGPNGFSGHFLRAYWEVVQYDVCTAVRDFFKKMSRNRACFDGHQVSIRYILLKVERRLSKVAVLLPVRIVSSIEWKITRKLKLQTRWKRQTMVTELLWQKPMNQWRKLNMDGSALDYSGPARVGGVIRDNRE
ncbi:hypothetical protein NE237_014707 [Protea cynaroides]|uniref:Uncharacterized protein n=1 Tax=Protea cynaroides TaxID=273540 RepID=A0A9Q0KCJ8_9MAGN|nr:hypothetical protein NE237_014707 [Protea cynaroides]